MSNAYHIVVCAGVVPDPLQTLEPITTATGPGLKNEMIRVTGEIIPCHNPNKTLATCP